MLKTQEVTTREVFYEQVYKWALSSTLPKIQVFTGCTVSRDSAGRTSSLILSFSKNNLTIEHKVVEREDHEDARGNEAEKVKSLINYELTSLSKYLSSPERRIPIPSTRTGNYLIVETYKSLESVFSH